MLLLHILTRLSSFKFSFMLLILVLVSVKTQWSEILTTKLQLPPHVYRISCQQNDTISVFIQIIPVSYCALAIFKFEYKPENQLYLFNNNNQDSYNFSVQIADPGSYYIQLKDFDHVLPIVEYSFVISSHDGITHRYSEKVFTLMEQYLLLSIGTFSTDAFRYKVEPADSLTTKLSVFEQTSHIQTILQNQIHYIEKRLKTDEFFLLLKPKNLVNQDHQIYFHLQCKQCVKKTSSEDSNHIGLIIGICLGSLFIVLTCILTIIFLRRKKNQSQNTYIEKPEAHNQNIQTVNVKNSLNELHPNDQYATVSNILCAICLQPKPNVVLSCKHQLHNKCVQSWKVSHQECPACRFTINNIIPIQLNGNSQLNNVVDDVAI